MSTFTCDIDESGTASSFVKLGFTEIVEEVGGALNRLVLGSAAMLLSAGVAASSLDGAFGRDVTETGHAVSSVMHVVQGTTTLVSRADADSYVGNGSALTEASTGEASSDALPGRELTADSAGAASSFALPSGGGSLTVTETARATSALVGYNDVTVLSSGDGSSSLVASRAAGETALSAGAGSTALVATNEPGVVLASTGTATSATEFAWGAGYVAASTGVAQSSVALPALPMQAWVLNSQSTAMSRYVGVPVRSLAVIGGKVLGIGEDGMYEMAGDKDNGVNISSSVKTGKSMMGFEALKNLGDVVISYVCAGVMQVRISCYGGPVEGTYTYNMPVREAKSPRGNRLVPGKGMRSRYYQFEFYSASASFGVDTVTADVAVNARRI